MHTISKTSDLRHMYIINAKALIEELTTQMSMNMVGPILV